MSIAFECDEVHFQKLRERLRQMTDEELVRFEKTVRALSEPRASVKPDPWKAQLEEARTEWRRRLPATDFTVLPRSQHSGIVARVPKTKAAIGPDHLRQWHQDLLRCGQESLQDLFEQRVCCACGGRFLALEC
jgi:hypothetical protein